MYDVVGADTGREWVELYNDGDEEINLSEYKFFEGEVNHKMTLVQGGEVLPPKSYAILVANEVKWKADWPTFGGIILDSTFSLSNTGESLEIKDKNLKTIDKYSYNSLLGGSEDGKSLQKIGGSWVASRPTPGVLNHLVVEAPKPAKIIEKTPPKEAKKSEKEEKILEIEPQISENLVASPTESQIVKNKNRSKNIFYFIFIFLIICSASGVFYIRKTKNKEKIGDDFEILDY